MLGRRQTRSVPHECPAHRRRGFIGRALATPLCEAETTLHSRTVQSLTLCDLRLERAPAVQRVHCVRGSIADAAIGTGHMDAACTASADNELVGAFEQLMPGSVSRVRYAPDESLKAQFGRFPPLLTPAAELAGFQHDGPFPPSCDECNPMAA